MVKSQFLIVISFFASYYLKGQDGYAVHFVNFKDEVNSTFCKSNTDGLCAILVDGYLNDKLKAYKFPQLMDQMRTVELQTENSPKRWSHKIPNGIELAEHFDIFQAEGFEQGTKQSKGQDPSIQKQVYSLSPTDLDTLSKKEFLEQLVLEQFEPSSRWDKDTLYKSGDVVFYDNNGYEALLDTVGITPTNKQCWKLSYRGSLPFYSMVRYINGISIIGYYETLDQDSIWYPKLIRLRKGAEWGGNLLDMDVTFLFSDVINYLNTIVQPILYKNTLGYIGKGLFVLRAEEEINLRKWIRLKIATKASLRKKVVIKNDTIFKKFLTGEAEDWTYSPWFLFQNPTNNNILLYRKDTLVANIPISSFLPFLKKESKSELFTYSQALNNNMFFGYIGDFSASFLQKSNTVANFNSAATGRDYFYLQKYFLETQTLQRDTILSLMQPVLKVITREFKNRNLQLREEQNTFYSAKYDWSKIPSVKAMGKDIKREHWINLLRDYIYPYAYPYKTAYDDNYSTYLQDTLQTLVPDTIQFGVTYKKHYSQTNSVKNSVEVVQVSFRDLRGNFLAPSYSKPVYTFNWNDIKQILQRESLSQFTYFIERIEKGEVLFSKAECIYGILEADN